MLFSGNSEKRKAQILEGRPICSVVNTAAKREAGEGRRPLLTRACSVLSFPRGDSGEKPGRNEEAARKERDEQNGEERWSRREIDRRGERENSQRWSQSQAGVLITSVCAGRLPGFRVYVHEQERRREREKGEFQARRERNSGMEGRGAKRGEEGQGGMRSMRGLALHWHAARFTIFPLQLFLLSFLLSTCLTSKFLRHSDPARISHS